MYSQNFELSWSYNGREYDSPGANVNWITSERMDKADWPASVTPGASSVVFDIAVTASSSLPTFGYQIGCYEPDTGLIDTLDSQGNVPTNETFHNCIIKTDPKYSTPAVYTENTPYGGAYLPLLYLRAYNNDDNRITTFNIKITFNYDCILNCI